MSEGPFPVDRVLADLEFGPDAVWHGPPPPLERIEPGAAPAGVVFVLLRGTKVVERAAYPGVSVAELVVRGAERHAGQMADDPSLRLAVFDGDHGRILMLLGGQR